MPRTQLVAAISFITLAVVLVLGITVLGVDESTTPFVTSVLAFIGLAVAQTVNAAKTESTEKAVTKLDEDLHNGSFERLIREALIKIAEDENTNLHITDNQREEDNSS